MTQRLRLRLTIRQVPIRLHPTAAILALLAAYSWIVPIRPAPPATTAIVAATAVVGVVASIMLHELGHVAAARL